MNQTRWQQIGTIVDQALDLETEKERTAFIKKNCNNDETLKKEVLDWIDSIADSKGLWDELLLSNHLLLHDMTLSEAPPLHSSPGELPQKIGIYSIKKRLGHGGMGDVYLAERSEGNFHKKVALKVIQNEVSNSNQVRRFLQERSLLSRLNHPNIARLLDGGVSGDGRPYFVMEYVDGLPITTYCAKHNCSLDQRLTLFGQVCMAVQYAHSNFIVHRDLKPDNLLVTKDGTLKVLDFGIAKLLDQELSEKNLLQTQAGQRILSLHYAAPEQITMQPVTAATDVYTLGLLLYELLTDARAFNLTNKTLLEAEQIIRSQEPAKPSLVTARWQNKLQYDLDAIVLKTLRKEPDRRYESASRLWEDIDRYRQARPVLARKDTVPYRISKFYWRHKSGITVSLIIFLLIVGLTGLYTWKIAQERDEANLQAEKAEKTTQFLTSLFTQADPQQSQNGEMTAREILDQGAENIFKELDDQPEVRARVLSVVGQAYFNINLLDKSDSLLSRALLIYQNLEDNQPSSDFAYAQWVMAKIKSALGKYNEAEKHIRSALAIYRTNKSENATETKQCLLDLSLILHEKRKFYQSNTYIDDWASKQPDESEAEFATRLVNEGQIAFVRGNYKEAEAKSRKALAIRMDLYGEHHAFTAIAMDRLSGALTRDKYYSAEAESLQAKAVSINNIVYDEPHHQWAYSIFKLAQIHKLRGDYKKSKELFELAINMMQKVRGAKNPYTLNIKLKYANLLNEMNELDAARTIYRELEPIYTRRYGEKYWFSIKCRERLALLLKKEKRFPEAAQLISGVINDYDEKYGQIHENSIYARLLFGQVLLQLGNQTEAEKWIKKSIDFLRQSKTDVKLKLGVAKRTLGLLRMQQQRYEEAENFLKKSYEFFEHARGPKSNYTKESLAYLIDLYKVWEKPGMRDKYQKIMAET